MTNRLCIVLVLLAGVAVAEDKPVTPPATSSSPVVEPRPEKKKPDEKKPDEKKPEAKKPEEKKADPKKQEVTKPEEPKAAEPKPVEPVKEVIEAVAKPPAPAPVVVEEEPPPVAKVVEAAKPTEVPPPPPSVDAGFGKGMSVADPKSGFTLNLRLRVQVRAVETLKTTAHAEDLFLRRLRVAAKGKLLRDDLEYAVQLGFAALDLEAGNPSPVRDAWLGWNATRDLNLRFGQMKVPFGLGRRVSSASFQFADMSTVLSELNLDRDSGLLLFSNDLLGLDSLLSYSAGVFAGEGRNRSFSKPGVLLAGRLAVKPFGKFDEFVEADLEQTPTPKLVLGVSGGVNFNSLRERSTIGAVFTRVQSDYLHADVDLQFKWRGLSVQSEWLLRRADSAGEASTVKDAEVTSSAWGAYGQVGYLITPRVEAVARGGHFEHIQNLPGPVPTNELGGGVNWYLQGHDLKFQLDGFRISRENKPTEVQIRLQTQFWL